MIMEYCPLGSVSDLLKKLSKPLSEESIKWILFCVLNGLLHLHHKDIIHSDIVHQGTLELRLTIRRNLPTFWLMLRQFAN